MVTAMKATLRELMDLFGVDRLFNPYDSETWAAYDATAGGTCNAEIHMDGDGKTVEAEIQFIYDTPPAGTPPVEQIMYIQTDRDMNGKWTPSLLRVRKDLLSGKVYDWEKKGGEFFLTVATHLRRNEVPDLEALIERIFRASEGYGTGTASGGSRKPMIRPEQLLDPTKKF